MIRLGLVSDSHANDSMLRAAAKALAGCDGLCHLGDVTDDGTRLARMLGAPLYAVRGNCDFLSGVPEEMTLAMEGYKILLTHGHRYGVKRSMTALSLRARETRCDIALYGHTHIAQVDRDGPMLLVNPGALCDGRCAVLEFRPNGPVPVLKFL